MNKVVHPRKKIMTTTSNHIRSIENILHIRYHLAPGFVVAKIVQILSAETGNLYNQLTVFLKDAFPGESIAEASATDILAVAGFTK